MHLEAVAVKGALKATENKLGLQQLKSMGEAVRTLAEAKTVLFILRKKKTLVC